MRAAQCGGPRHVGTSRAAHQRTRASDRENAREELVGRVGARWVECELVRLVRLVGQPRRLAQLARLPGEPGKRPRPQPDRRLGRGGAWIVQPSRSEYFWGDGL